VTQRIRPERFTAVMLLIACSVACAGALSAPAQAQPERAEVAAARQPANTPGREHNPAPRQSAATVGGQQLAASGVVVNYPSRRAARLPDLPASGYVVADAGTGQVLAAKDPHGLFLPASTLKVLTAIALIPRLNPDATAVASQQATAVTPNVVGLVAGQRYKVSDLFSALLLISANDAAIALAEATGSLRHGVALMNAEASHLQAYDVVAKDPNGLDAAGQHASAYGLALIARQAVAMPAFMTYDSALEAPFPVTPARPVTLFNQNSLLTHYPGGIGGKIGWTSAAGATYIGLARRNGVTLIVTLLHCPALTEVAYAARLLDWGFAMDGRVRPVGDLVAPLQPAPARPSAKPAPGRQAASPATAEARGIPSETTAVTAALIMFAAAAAVVLALLRRRGV
jgi:D-alanyl-D-alanine carboxypeptidase (penicillin-binding protein 5/6)